LKGKQHSAFSKTLIPATNGCETEIGCPRRRR